MRLFQCNSLEEGEKREGEAQDAEMPRSDPWLGLSDALFRISVNFPPTDILGMCKSILDYHHIFPCGHMDVSTAIYYHLALSRSLCQICPVIDGIYHAQTH